MSTCSQSIHEVFDHQKTDLLLHLFEESSDFHTVVIFVKTRDSIHELSNALNRADIITEAVPGSKKLEVRECSVRDLVAKKIRAIVATEVALRDLDLTGICHVVHFDFHELDQDYLSQASSAQKEVTTLVTPKDTNALQKLEKLVGESLPKKIAENFAYDRQPNNPKGIGGGNKTKSKPLQHKKPKLKNKGPRRKTGRTRKR